MSPVSAEMQALLATPEEELLSRLGQVRNDHPVAAEILRVLEVPKIRLLTRNPDKVGQLRTAGIEVVQQVKTGLHVNPRNEKYLQAKERRAARAVGSDLKRGAVKREE